jgi:AraC family transcriptional regulator
MEHYRVLQRRAVAEDNADAAVRHLDLARGIAETFARCATANAMDNADYVRSEPPRRDGVDQRVQASADAGRIESFLDDVRSKNGNDGVVRSISRVLEAARRQHDEYCTEGPRLAVPLSLLGLRSEAGALVKSSEIEPTQRRVLALQKWRLKRVVEHVDDHLSAKITLSDLAAVAGLSRMHFASQFRMATGFRPHEFVLRRRIGRAEELLKHTSVSIVEIALAVGFQTQAHLTTVFKRFVGCTPGRWRAIKQMPIASPTRKDRRAEFMDAVEAGAARGFMADGRWSSRVPLSGAACKPAGRVGGSRLTEIRRERS